MKAVLRRGNHRKLLEQPKVTGEIVPEMLKVLTTLAGQQRVRIVEKALSGIRTELEAEKARLVDLAQLNPMIDDEELQKLDRYQEQVVKAVSNARLRLDSLRLIYRMPAP
jgi:ATP-dependent helicase HepA